MSHDPSTGIPNPDRPGHWLVPPWPADATFCEVVAHFLRFTPPDDNTVHLLTYFQGYHSALESAATDDLTLDIQQKWASDVRECVTRCLKIYRRKITQLAG